MLRCRLRARWRSSSRRRTDFPLPEGPRIKVSMVFLFLLQSFFLHALPPFCQSVIFCHTLRAVSNRANRT